MSVCWGGVWGLGVDVWHNARRVMAGIVYLGVVRELLGSALGVSHIPP